MARFAGQISRLAAGALLSAVALTGLRAVGQQKGGDAGADPLALGETALAKHDNQGALEFFSRFTTENPGDVRARFLLGGTHLQMGDAKAAAEDFQKAIALDATFWPAHLNLVVADALAGDWTAFDTERAVLKAARDAGRPGLAKEGHDTIDIFHVGDKTFHAWAFYKLNGNFHTRYTLVHIGPDGKPTEWFQCESDDADQIFFRQKHPTKAAAGARSFSLDSYRFEPNGTITQGLIRFYMDGEPTYEQVRADVLAALNRSAGPVATTNPGTAPPGAPPADAKPHAPAPHP